MVNGPVEMESGKLPGSGHREQGSNAKVPDREAANTINQLPLVET
jgi:hypothetical protein